MIRKQLCITPEQQEKVRRLAVCWGSSEAEVIRRAIDRLPDPDTWPAGQDDVPTTAEALDALERKYEAWVDALPEPLGLSQAVIEDRR
jgi:antitoxin ParD1/3/4